MVMKGYDFGQVEGNDGHPGALHKFARVAGAYPPQHVVKRGGILLTSRAPRCRSPKQRGRKKQTKKVGRA